MRLSVPEIKNIIDSKDKVFGSTSKIYLFGSRVNNSKKGGDIDLYIVPDNSTDLLNKKLEFINLLQMFFGDRKIDVVLSTGSNRLIDSQGLEGIELDLNKVKLEKYFNECDKHLQRIEEAYSDLSDSIPFTAESYSKLSKDIVQAMDQYLFRFAKLQDTLGDKIFKIIGSLYNNNDTPIPFIDLLNLLEKLGFIFSANEWINLRAIRNQVTHSYDDDPVEMSLAMNSIIIQKDVLKKIYLNLKDKYKEKL